MLPSFIGVEQGADEAEGRKRFIATIPWGRLNRPDDLANAAVFLASAASDYVNGELLVVDGGWMGR